MDSTAGINDDKGPSIIAATTAVTSVATVFVIARLYVRGRLLSKLQVDDYLIVISIICGWLSTAFAITSVKSGNGRHIQFLENDQLSGAVLWTMVGFLPGIWSFALPKIAAVALLTRLMNPSKRQRIFLWTISISCMVILTGCIFLLFAQCTPSRAQWDFSIKEKTCWDPYVLVDYSIVAGSISALVDFYLAVYPGIVLFQLQMNIKKKIALSVSLGLGSIAGIVAIYKSTRIPGLASSDFTYDTADLTIWTCIEGSTIVIGTCIPTLRPLAEKLLGTRAFGSSGDRYGYKNYGSSKSGQQKSDIEMGSKKRAKYPHDLDTFVDVKGGSEENILPSPSTRVNPKPEGIVRTQSVSISYGDEPVAQPTQSYWK
ncbi:hypothetical protein F4778DRAFT_717446 [Xylariomycetidae sp. FL2044]|nr:hypothetical protein F4778DRAFT_717446 [Xylariomycetidae sp. FL2044]